MTTFEIDPDLTDAEMSQALQAVVDYLKQRPDISCTQIRMNRFFLGAEVAAPTGSYSCMRVERQTGGRWTISQRNDPPRRGLLALIDGY
jgi:hypothetical protein